MTRLGDAFDALMLASRDEERTCAALDRYRWCLRQEWRDEVLATLMSLEEEVRQHETAHVTVLLCEARLREALPDEPPPERDDLDEADPT